MAPTMRRCLCAAAVVAALVRGASAADGIYAADGGARAHGALERPGGKGSEDELLGRHPEPDLGNEGNIAGIKKVKADPRSTKDTAGTGQPTTPPPDGDEYLDRLSDGSVSDADGLSDVSGSVRDLVSKVSVSETDEERFLKQGWSPDDIPYLLGWDPESGTPKGEYMAPHKRQPGQKKDRKPQTKDRKPQKKGRGDSDSNLNLYAADIYNWDKQNEPGTQPDIYNWDNIFEPEPNIFDHMSLDEQNGQVTSLEPDTSFNLDDEARSNADSMDVHPDDTL
uniref:Uncharacterized protein n=1 Tax=Zooxanthella nutricula TaxID=1333877 RepID=A0A7S2NDJ4_9DINO|mmetsp:Transcript_24969/g.75003  ORF Transcript_24969/g.75003 Transcript_24969/m.75003 type:complete len:280 (+) Transcript_24969:99-938(+)